MNCEAIFNSLYAAMPLSRASLRVDGGRKVIEKAVTSGISMSRQPTEEGIAVSTDSYARFLASADAGGDVAAGEPIEIKMAAQTKWHKFRVAETSNIGGVVRVGLEAEFA